ncbi:MAG: hypothetical protein ACOYLO_16240, partial [Ferruginibacter sp.]
MQPNSKQPNFDQFTKALGVTPGVVQQPQTPQWSSTLKDLYSKSAPTPAPVTKNLGDKVADRFIERGAEANRIMNDPTEGSSVTRGLKMAAQGAGAVTDVATETIKSIPGADLVGRLFSKMNENATNYNAKQDKKFEDMAHAKGKQTLQEQLGQILIEHPEVAKKIENTLGAISATGEIAGTIAGAEVVPKTPLNLSGTINEVKTGVSNVKNTLKVGSEKKALDESIKNTMPHQTKDVRINELRNAMPDSEAGKGGVTRKGLSKTSTPVSSAKDVEVGTTAHKYIKGEKDPVKRIQNVNKGIQDTSSGTDKFLDANPTNANFEDIRGYMETNKPTPSIVNDPGAMETYNRVNESTINTIYDTLKSSAKKSGDFSSKLSGKDIRQARIKIDQ